MLLILSNIIWIQPFLCYALDSGGLDLDIHIYSFSRSFNSKWTTNENKTHNRQTKACLICRRCRSWMWNHTHYLTILLIDKPYNHILYSTKPKPFTTIINHQVVWFKTRWFQIALDLTSNAGKLRVNGRIACTKQTFQEGISPGCKSTLWKWPANEKQMLPEAALKASPL